MSSLWYVLPPVSLLLGSPFLETLLLVLVPSPLHFVQPILYSHL